LARVLGAHVLDRDGLRAQVFGPRHVQYSPAQNDLCAAWLVQAAAWLARNAPGVPVVFDGQTFVRRAAAARLERAARRAGASLVWLVVSVAPSLARRRLLRARHAAADRGPELHERLRRQLRRQRGFDLRGPRIDVDGAAPARDSAARVRDWLAELPRSGRCPRR
jgi:hypothetical protein